MRGIYLAGESFFEAFSVIKKGKMRKFYLLPGVINLILINLLYRLSKYVSFNIFSKLETYFNLSNYENIAFMVIKVIIIVLSFLLYFLMYKALLLIVLSPFLNYISERTERALDNRKFEFSFRDNIRFIWRGIVISCKSFSKEMIGTLILLLLGIIPFLSLTIPFFIFLLQAYYIGFSFMDYTLERHNYSSEESLIFLKKNWVFSAFSGALFTMVFLIPLVGVFIAPLVSCVAVTLGTLKIINNEKYN